MALRRDRGTLRKDARVLELDPLADARWLRLLQRHPRASVFHSPDWLRALRMTYGYEPLVLTTSQAGTELENGLLLCRVQSWLTGNRLVSLPFSDHCEPLVDSPEEFDTLVKGAQASVLQHQQKYVELRPTSPPFADSLRDLGFISTGDYVCHRIDLNRPIDDVFRRLDRSSVRRRVHHAEKIGLSEDHGNSILLLKDFYRLFVRTRARHGVPPQPFVWFRNLVECLGDALDLRVARMNGQAIAAVLTLHFGAESFYKYGCSDERFHQAAAMPFLLWSSIREAHGRGSKVFDLGRTRSDQQGLIRFKNHWASAVESLTYWSYPSHSSVVPTKEWKLSLMKGICTRLPSSWLELAGTLLYRHIA